jgi:hypothetical protein
MKEINTFQLVKVPEGIEASVKSRIVTVKGSRGTLNKDFKHLAVDIYMPDSKTIKVRPVVRIRDVYPGSRISQLVPCNVYYLLFEGTFLHLHNFSKIKKTKKSQDDRNQCFSYYFCLMIEGCGSVPLEAQEHTVPDPDPQHSHIKMMIFGTCLLLDI